MFDFSVDNFACQIRDAGLVTKQQHSSHLAVAASSMLQAASAVLMPKSDGHRNDSGPVERIDLDVDNWEDED